MSHIIHSSDTVKDCAPAVVHALVTLLAAICQLHSVSDVADVARNWARLCEALVSVHLKAIVKQVPTVLNLHNITNQNACYLFVSCVVPAVRLCRHRNLAAIEDIAACSGGAAAASRGWRSCPCQLLRQEAGDIVTVLCVHHSISSNGSRSCRFSRFTPAHRPLCALYCESLCSFTMRATSTRVSRKSCLQARHGLS
jgi:hypothetical protein